MIRPLLLLILAGAALTACQQMHPAAQTVPVLDAHH